MRHDEHQHHPAELESLADYLIEKQDEILARWEEAVTREEEQIATLASLSQKEFYNNIPEFLDHLCNYLRNGKSTVEHVARGHGAQRWKHGVDLREVIHEWNQLHQVLLDYMDQVAESLSLSPVSLSEAQRRLARHIHAGISRSVDTYYSLMRRKANRELQDLEAVVRQQSIQKGQREVNLHQVSHDLKGSMTALRMNLNLLERIELSDQARELVKHSSRAAESLTQLLENLLEHSRLQAGREQLQVEEFDAAGLLGSLCENMQPMAGDQGLELRSSGEAPLRVRGDRLKVRRIAQNLLQNALKYTRRGYVEVAWNAGPDNHWQLTISDTGPGLDLASEALFTGASPEKDAPFREMPDDPGKQQSEGVGLLIVRQLCKLLGAVVETESEPDTGTTFRITFPADYPDR